MYKHSGLTFIGKLLVSMLITVSFLFCSSDLKAKSSKDVVLVLDTSLSMVGYGGKNILSSVKFSISQFIDKEINDGDKVTFVTFDEDVKVFPQILIDDENDRDILKKYISVTEAKGKWTYTLKMISQVFAIADEMSKSEESGRNVVIVIMSDGLDDPPPGKRREVYNLKEISNKYSGKDWWIYLVDLAKLKDTDKLKKAHEKLKGELSKISKNTQVIGGADPAKAINQMSTDIKQKQNRQFILTIVFIVLLVLGLLLVLLFIIRRINAVRVEGSLEYWNHELIKPDVIAIDLSRFGSNVLTVGRTPDCDVKIREYESRQPFALKAVREKGEVKTMLLIPDGVDHHFKNKEESQFVGDGDIFQVANFSFRYKINE